MSGRLPLHYLHRNHLNVSLRWIYIHFPYCCGGGLVRWYSQLFIRYKTRLVLSINHLAIHLLIVLDGLAWLIVVPDRWWFNNYIFSPPLEITFTWDDDRYIFVMVFGGFPALRENGHILLQTFDNVRSFGCWEWD